MSLRAKRGIETYPDVATIINSNETTVVTKGNFGKATYQGKDYYYIIDIEEKIDTAPQNYKVVNSTKHDALFIVDATSSSGFTGKF